MATRVVVGVASLVLLGCLLQSLVADLHVPFSYHPLLMTIAFSFFMSQAMLVFTSGATRKVWWHKRLNVAGSLLAVLGLAAIVYTKEMNGKPHRTSWHGYIGAPLVILYIFQNVIGALMHNGAIPYIPRRWQKLLHHFSAIFSFNLAGFMMYLGFQTTWFTSVVPQLFQYVAMAASGTVWICTDVVVLGSLYYRYKRD